MQRPSPSRPPRSRADTWPPDVVLATSVGVLAMLVLAIVTTWGGRLGLDAGSDVLVGVLAALLVAGALGLATLFLVERVRPRS